MIDDHSLYEAYVEVYVILEWRDGAVFRTESVGHRWVSMETTKANHPNVTNVIYAAANDEFAKNNMTIRKAAKNDDR